MNARSTVDIGAVFARLTVLRVFAHKGNMCCAVKCDCAAELIVQLHNLASGRTKSCGCLRKETTAAMRTTHGATGTLAHQVWDNMIKRVSSSKSESWSNYGGRGITVCLEWRNFANFLRDMGQPPKGMQLDREKNHLGYSKENCRWVTRNENQRNKRTNVSVQYAGRTMCLTEAAEISGLSWKTLRNRLKKGQIGEELFRPSRNRRHFKDMQ